MPDDRPEVYVPTTRMAKALRLGVLESTRKWLADAALANPDATVGELLAMIDEESDAAELELERYDELDPDRSLLPSRNLR